MRTISLFGLSDVKLQFTYDLTYEEAEQRVLNRLSQLPQLPNQAQATISPTSPIGEIFRYRLVGPPNYSVMDLKTLQEWVWKASFCSPTTTTFWKPEEKDPSLFWRLARFVFAR